MAKPKPHDSDYEHEVDPPTEDEATTARMDLPSAYTMHGRLQLDGLLAYSVRAKVEEAAPIVEPPALRGRWLLLQGAQRENLEGRVSHIENTKATSPAGDVAAQ